MRKLSAYEMKNNCCLIESLFKKNKNGIFLFGIFRDIDVFAPCKLGK